MKLLPIVAALAVTSAGAMALAPPSFAQLPSSPAEAEKQLGITAAQKAKITAINKKYQPKIQVLQKQMASLNTQYGKEMETIFTPAQKAKMKQWQALQAQQQQGGGMGGAMGGKP
ncbi:MAG: hypothetical protein H7Y38_11060 [Armatimonadetes bacterium]|nr:hypothetical protein [Armatimonadota bacterium]